MWPHNHKSTYLGYGVWLLFHRQLDSLDEKVTITLPTPSGASFRSLTKDLRWVVEEETERSRWLLPADMGRTVWNKWKAQFIVLETPYEDKRRLLEALPTAGDYLGPEGL